MTETEMMQRVVAILTQAREMVDLLDEDDERDDLNGQSETIGELIAETLRVEASAPADASPQLVADVVAKAIQPRVGLLVACFTAAFTRLAQHHDERDSDATSTDVLRTLALEWEMSGDEPA